MRRVLLVSPHFPPANAPDHQRVRMCLPYCQEFGWQPIVLAVDPKFVEAPQDELLLRTIPADIPIHRIAVLDQALTRKVGLGNLGLRALPAIKRKGRQIIADESIDLVYFSTAMFAAATAGRAWRSRFGVPFVVDFQDPWLSTYYEERPELSRPRKYWFAHNLDRLLEPWTMKAAAGATVVSPDYCETLTKRYRHLRSHCLTLPFGASARDLELAATIEFNNDYFRRGDGFIHGIYVGVVPPAMATTIGLMMEALARGVNESPDLFSKVRLHFIGTSYATPGHAKPSVLPIAARAGVASLVNERTSRVSYLHALRLLDDADFLIVPGSDDPQYTASKIYPYILARKPMLAVFHRNSSVVDVLRATKAGDVIPFHKESDPTALRTEVFDRWENLLRRLPFTPDTDWAAFEPFTAREMTRRLCGFFDHVLEGREEAG